MMFDLDSFINSYVTGRQESLFLQDIEKNQGALAKKINGKSFLVIGGAGSIGASFIGAILKFKPSELVVVDVNENGLAELTRSLRSDDSLVVPDKYVTYSMDFASTVFEKMFVAHRGFDVVANFSAHKHVRSEKDIYSVEALIRNNVINAKKLLDLLTEFPPEEFFCVSTDKAANPVNIMGASKRIMEDVIFSYSDIFPVKTARFANVAFSNGSLPDGFMHRINKLQPLSAPLDVKRYFVSLKESGEICMLACFLGENREIFFPKLKESQMMTFDKIALNLLNEMGYEAKICASEQEAIEYSHKLKLERKLYPVYFSKSDTSGEKSFEEFYTDDEEVDLLRLESLGVVINKNKPDKSKVEEMLGNLEQLLDTTDATKDAVVKVMSCYLPNFRHIEKNKSLDEKM